MGPSDRAETGTHGTIRVVISDDHAVVRRGLRQLLDTEEGFEVVAEASDLEGARRYVRGHHPDVLVLDLTMQDEPAYARHALSAGALGYVLKESAESQLVEAIRRAAAGDAYLNRGWGRASPPSRRLARPTACPSARSRCSG